MKVKYLKIKKYWFVLASFVLVFVAACWLLAFISQSAKIWEFEQRENCINLSAPKCSGFGRLWCNLKTPFYESSAIDITKILNAMPEDDREALEWFFRCLFHDTFSYVLFGSKPMSISSFLKIEPSRPPIYRVADFMDLSIGLASPVRLKMHRGWEVWKKYEHFFPSSNFFLLENRDLECITIVMINKYFFLKKIEENIDDFKEVLGSQITPEKIFEDYLKANDVFKDVLNSHEGLLGTLLGYGRHNAQLFLRRNQIEKIIKSQEFSSTKQSFFPSKGFDTLDEEYRNINEKLVSFDTSQIMDFNPLLIMLPGFAADQEASETQQLKIEYKKQYKNIMKRYKNGDFLEITLRKFVQGDC